MMPSAAQLHGAAEHPLRHVRLAAPKEQADVAHAGDEGGQRGHAGERLERQQVAVAASQRHADREEHRRAEPQRRHRPGPTRSTRTPTGTTRTAAQRKKALESRPASVGPKPSSGISSGSSGAWFV